MPFGVETLSDSELQQLLAMYNEKIRRLRWRLYDVLYTTAYTELPDELKTKIQNKISTFKTLLGIMMKPAINPEDVKLLEDKIARLLLKKTAVQAELKKRGTIIG